MMNHPLSLDIILNANQETMHKDIGTRKAITPSVKYIDKYIVYLSPSFIDKERKKKTFLCLLIVSSLELVL